MRTKQIGTVEVSTDGRTVWVNSDSAGAVGRFGKVGIDIHNRNNDSCENCGPHQGNYRQSWSNFRRGIMKVHGMMVPDDFKPPWVG